MDAKDNVTELTISNRTILRVVGVVIAALLVLATIQQASGALVLVFVAFFLALALNSPVHALARRLPGKKKGSRVLATTLSAIIVLALFVAFLASLVPPLVRQTQNFITAAPGYVSDIRDQNGGIGEFIRKYNLEEQVNKLSQNITSKLDDASGAAVTTITSIGSGLVKLVTVLVMTFMMLVEGPRWVRLAQNLVPKKHRQRATELSRNMYGVVRGYVNGQVTLAAIAALLITPMLFILGISYPIALAVIVFVCGLIPMIGHYIGATIVTLVALFASPWAALIILGYYVLYQQIENYAVQPRVQSNSTNMSPLLVFVSVVIGASFSGLLGALVAIPIAGCLRILVLDVLKRRDLLPAPAEYPAQSYQKSRKKTKADTK
ncbi:MAG: AI-2E family transporter [Candidatus Saccharimonadales bacterium]